MKTSLKNQIAKCSEIRKDFNSINVTNLFPAKDIEAHYYLKIRELFAEEYPSTESYFTENDSLLFRFNDVDFAKLSNYVVNNTDLDVIDRTDAE
jgi:hypothetical protein